MQLQKALGQQQNEIDEYHIYTQLAAICKDEHNREIFKRIAADELRHYNFWKEVTGKELEPRKWKVRWYLFLAKFFGIAFALKLMERGEEKAQNFYAEVAKEFPQARQIAEDEMRHEKELLSFLEDRKLAYAGAVVLGMNDALVELTGTLTGVALAFDNAKYVGITGVIMGIAASLSMAGSAYLEARENSGEVEPKKYALYTGISYIITTVLVVFPFFLFSSAKAALGLMFINAVLAIIIYNFYIAVARDEDFGARVKEMFVITFGVAFISFIIGYFVNSFFGIEV